MNVNELEPCPFCGGNNLHFFIDKYPECKDCGACIDIAEHTNPIKAWNTRSTPKVQSWQVPFVATIENNILRQLMMVLSAPVILMVIWIVIWLSLCYRGISAPMNCIGVLFKSIVKFWNKPRIKNIYD